MLKKIKKRNITRKRRVLRIRKKLRGNLDKPRMSVFKSNKNLFVQIIDDENSKTLVGMGTGSKEFKGAKKSKETALALGRKIAEAAIGKNIQEVIFDRGRYKYHGLLSELAKGAREAGLKF